MGHERCGIDLSDLDGDGHLRPLHVADHLSYPLGAGSALPLFPVVRSKPR
jgi:hypothetical protein